MDDWSEGKSKKLTLLITQDNLKLSWMEKPELHQCLDRKHYASVLIFKMELMLGSGFRTGTKVCIKIVRCKCGIDSLLN